MSLKVSLSDRKTTKPANINIENWEVIVLRSY